MLGYYCQSKSGHLGIINREMEGNEKFPDQWGVFWLGGKRLIPSYYWNDKNLIWIGLNLNRKRMKVTRELLNRLTNRTVRSFHQTKFLLDLLGGENWKSFQKLVLLEEKIKNTFTFYCPDDLEEVEKLMKMEDKTDLLNLSEFKK